ncbi:hypothetical protein HELRODRAFT_194135 [Helobdella robusta]|uniref:Uncharacterized protein n=1 Tax=Helobdella robusta TaxID=6412 RepID=T1FVQ7_HELRO|nr:hypothetical protein HELRODRAFT_194135 [Helobdella robusta]ESN93331.1 hypothetical protein HELRODRAFT_194135 [Helobdella robusta]
MFIFSDDKSVQLLGSKKFKVTKVVNFTPAKEYVVNRDYETVTTNDGAEPAAELKPAADEDVVNVKNETKDSSSPYEFEASKPDDDAQIYDFQYSKNVQAVVNPIVTNQTKLDSYGSLECSDLNLKSEVDSTERLKIDCVVHYLWRIEERPNNSVLVVSVIFGEENSSKFMSDRMCNDERYKKFNMENRFPLRMIKDLELGNPVEIKVYDISYKCDNDDIVLKPMTRTIPVYEYIKETPLHVAFHMDVDVPQSRLKFTRFTCNVVLLHIPATFSFYLKENIESNQLDALIPEKVNKTTGQLGQDRSAPKDPKIHEMANHACLSNQFHTLHTSEQYRYE